jgi:hypothetical protein
MPELIDPREEKACQLRASGKTQLDAYNAAFEVPDDSKANNSSRFFRRDDAKIRVSEIKRRRAVLADLDEAWVLKQLKAIAKNGELIGNANLDDYFVHTENGRRIGIELTDVPRKKMAALDEVTVEQYTEGPRDDPQTVKRTKIKLKTPVGATRAAELIGDWLGMWAPTKIAPTNPQGDGPPLAPEITDADRVRALENLLARQKTEAA